jgi:hypothetical protein
MKKLIPAVVVAAALAIPAISFAQSSQQGLTRAQVRAELVELQQAGYNPAIADNADYPHNLQAAQARVTEERLANAGTSGYGAPAAGTTQAGGAAQSVERVLNQPVNYGN